jgi:hypothetical protein
MGSVCAVKNCVGFRDRERMGRVPKKQGLLKPSSRLPAQRFETILQLPPGSVQA